MSNSSDLQNTNSYASIIDWYRNTIWGKAIPEDNDLFEIMSLQVFQAGLTWNMILKRRDTFREAFALWDIKTVAEFKDSDVNKLLKNKGIIRNRLKIQATIHNAKIILSIQSDHDSFCNWFYNVIQGAEYPSIQKELRKTFKFMGPEIARMWLLAAGRITKEEGEKYRPHI